MNKPELYFIPGTMCDPLIWSKIWPELSSQFELIHLPIPDEDNIDDLLSSLSASLPQEQVNLIGFSMGGYLATCLAEQAPRRFTQVLVLSNSPCALPEAEMTQRKQTINWLERFQYRGITKQKALSMLAQSPSDSDELLSIIAKMEQNLGYDTLLTQFKATSYRSDQSAFLATNKTKLGFCFGDQDKLVNKPWLHSLAKQHGFDAIEVPNCGHMLPLEQPESLISVIQNRFT